MNEVVLVPGGLVVRRDQTWIPVALKSVSGDLPWKPNYALKWLMEGHTLTQSVISFSWLFSSNRVVSLCVSDIDRSGTMTDSQIWYESSAKGDTSSNNSWWLTEVTSCRLCSTRYCFPVSMRTRANIALVRKGRCITFLTFNASRKADTFVSFVEHWRQCH